MKKNIIWSLFAFVIVAMLSTGFVACGDDDSNDSGSGTKKGVVGTWSGTSHSHKETLSLTFKSGGSGTWISRYYDSYSGTETNRGSFTYEMEGKYKGIIIINDNKDSYSYSSGHSNIILFFEIEDDTMFIYLEDYGDNLGWTLTKQ